MCAEHAKEQNAESFLSETRQGDKGFKSRRQAFEIKEDTPVVKEIRSELSEDPAIEFAQVVELQEGEGTFIYYPEEVKLDIGDVFYLRERQQGKQTEQGIIIQVIRTGIANYPQADTKALFRLMTAVRARQIERTHHEPPETIDQFLAATFKVRASIQDGKWGPSQGRVVTRNVDIFRINPVILTANVLEKLQNKNIQLGDYKADPVEFIGKGFDKVNIITGMKGEGKSYIAKGIISETLRLGMSSVVFDINDEYYKDGQPIFNVKGGGVFRPGAREKTDKSPIPLKFRLDRITPTVLLKATDMLARFPDKTRNIARAEIPGVIEDLKREGHIPDLNLLRKKADTIFPGRGEAVEYMRDAYKRSLNIVERYNIIATEEEAKEEDKFIKQGDVAPVVTLTSAFHNIHHRQMPSVIILSIGGMLPELQKVVVNFVIDSLEELCERQERAYQQRKFPYPLYPTVYFEEAHMYMQEEDINTLVPLIRHLGMNLFFITNTPGALPDSVFRLTDNLIMTRLVNEQDIKRVQSCGLSDEDTLRGFSTELMERHALLLSQKEGITKSFPLVFHVREDGFGLPPSGQARSTWRVLYGNWESEAAQTQETPNERKS